MSTVEGAAGLNDSFAQGCYVVLHMAPTPSAFAEANGSPLIVSDASTHFQLSEDIWIERLDERLAKNIQQACEPAHYKINNAGYDRHLYAFVRRANTGEKSKYEGMSDLHALIALSRLVNPTSTGDRYCAQVFQYGAKDSPVYAIQYRGMSPDVALATNSRDWLSVEDGEFLCKLMPWLLKKMHPRVHRAYWNHEYTMRSYYLDARWPLVVSGLEALISVGEDDPSWQFRDRGRQLASEFKIDLTDDDLRVAYRLRSKLVHAEGFLSGLETVLPQNEHSPLYGKLESLLRQTLRRSLMDETFGGIFRDDDSVKARFPLSAKPKK